MPAINIAAMRSTPWEEIGQDVHGVDSPEEMLRRTGLNWTVHRVPLEGRFRNHNNVEHKITSNTYALVRDADAKVLSEVPEKWKPIQNVEAFKFFSDFCKATDLELTRAGALKQGQLVWALAKMPRDFFTINKLDRVQSYLLFTNRHEYGTMLDIRLNPIRVLTKSTVTMPLEKSGEQVVRMGHMAQEHRELNVADADEIMTMARQRFSYHKKNSLTLALSQYRPNQLKHYFNSLFPAMSRDEADGSKAYKRALELVETLPGSDITPKSWWNAFCTVCYMCDVELGQQDPSRLFSAWYGPNKERKKKAMLLALEAANKS